MTDSAEDTALFPTEPFASRARQIIEACPLTPEGVVEEVFDQDVYHLGSIDVRGKIVVDIGANVGAFTLAALEAGADMVVASEPEPDNFRVLLRNVDLYGFGAREHVLASALAIHEHNGAARLVGDQGAGRVVALIEDDLPNVQIRTLASFLALFLDPGQSVALVKMDVEGAEVPIFAAPDISDALEHIDHVSMEFHVNTLAAIIPVLSRTHHIEIMGSDERGGYVWARRYGL